ncbi:hypothetical protein GOQ27_02430 [Clostridium sp. D2Q-11]|uniref:Uncharacterized protein n=1 Tax=Anaeromonas frigoriresistens TaxID=2683708 RepID=A0A942URL2_9FIRM|nr:hypothetical protein [Anaeromonas frigoriresistens]MBS4537298.1 hypothetical protein [Anaeromonas frigoriresistens]
MNENIVKMFKEINKKDNNIRLNALNQLLKITDSPVDWFDDIYHELVEKLKSNNSYQRSISILLLCNLAKSDKNNKITDLIAEILTHTSDKKFITSRQCIQNIWKIAIIDESYKNQIVKHLKKQYLNCKEAKHYNLIREDIIETFNNIYKNNIDKKLKEDILKLIEIEESEKFKKKYLKIIK